MWKRDPYITDAQELIDKLPAGKEKDQLQARLDAIINGSAEAGDDGLDSDPTKPDDLRTLIFAVGVLHRSTHPSWHITSLFEENCMRRRSAHATRGTGTMHCRKNNIMNSRISRPYLRNAWKSFRRILNGSLLQHSWTVQRMLLRRQSSLKHWLAIKQPSANNLLARLEALKSS